MLTSKALSRQAPAKINLALHVLGQQANGYHELDSLVVFADICDYLEAEQVRGADCLTIHGPFGSSLEANYDNLVLKAVAAVRTLQGNSKGGIAFKLKKNLPVSSGIGGGSADAAAALELISEIWPSISNQSIDNIARSLGADIPMCLVQTPLRATGLGEKIETIPHLPSMAIVLINPLVPISTPAVFDNLEQKSNQLISDIGQGWRDFGEMISFLDQTRNDLASPARILVPQIAEIEQAMGAQQHCALARMTGSGATIFGLFKNLAQAKTAADKLATKFPAYWVKAGRVLNKNQ